jgi:hypothetical protein
MPFDCRNYIANIEYNLQNLPEYNNIYRVSVTDVQQLGSSGSQQQQAVCDVSFNYVTLDTGYTQKAARRVTFEADADGYYAIRDISAEPPSAFVNQNVTEQEVLSYYKELRQYNENWIKYGWNRQPAGPYNPPRPKWSDQLFERNVLLYNQNLTQARPYIAQALARQSGSSPLLNELFRKAVAPVPADPLPPRASNVLVPYKRAPSDLEVALNDERAAADTNEQTIVGAQAIYDSLLSPSSPYYDPPVAGDDYETVLIKLNKAFDTAAASGSASANYAGSDPSPYNRRLAGRLARTFPVPGPVLPATNIPAATNYAPYTFTERQQYLIDYTPVSDKATLKGNMCKSLGYLPMAEAAATGLCDPSGGDCCAPLPDIPRYTGSLQEGFSGSASQRYHDLSGVVQRQQPRGCTVNSVPLGSRTTTVSVPSRPLNVDTSNRLFSYRMSNPVEHCRPRPQEPQTVDQALAALRPAIAAEVRKNLQGDKMFGLRCPSSCLQD